MSRKSSTYALAAVLTLSLVGLLAPSSAHAADGTRITNVEVYHNQPMGYQGNGMTIYVDYIVDGHKGHTCDITAYFSFTSGQRLVDSNGSYRAVDGHISVNYRFVPIYETAKFTRVALSIPYSELHLARGFHELKFDLEIKEPYSDNLLLGASRNHFFDVTNY